MTTTEELLALIDRLEVLLERSGLAELEVEAGELGIVLRKPGQLMAGTVPSRRCPPPGRGRGVPTPPTPRTAGPSRPAPMPSRSPMPGPAPTSSSPRSPASTTPRRRPAPRRT